MFMILILLRGKWFYIYTRSKFTEGKKYGGLNRFLLYTVLQTPRPLEEFAKPFTCTAARLSSSVLDYHTLNRLSDSFVGALRRHYHYSEKNFNGKKLQRYYHFCEKNFHGKKSKVFAIFMRKLQRQKTNVLSFL